MLRPYWLARLGLGAYAGAPLLLIGIVLTLAACGGGQVALETGLGRVEERLGRVEAAQGAAAEAHASLEARQVRDAAPINRESSTEYQCFQVPIVLQVRDGAGVLVAYEIRCVLGMYQSEALDADMRVTFDGQEIRMMNRRTGEVAVFSKTAVESAVGGWGNRGQDFSLRSK